MTALSWAVVLLFIAFGLHLVLWRICLPRRQTKALLGIFLGVLVAAPLCSTAIAEFCPALSRCLPEGVTDWLRIALLHISVTLAYMITYSAIEADSPSLVMVMAIANAGPDGMDAKEFEATLNDDLLIRPRVTDLITDKMAYREGDRYKLTRKGLLFANIFVHYRRLLKAAKGG